MTQFLCFYALFFPSPIKLYFSDLEHFDIY